MRILYVIDTLKTGGKERQLIELLKGLKGHPCIQYELVTMSDRIDYGELASIGVRPHVLVRTHQYDLLVLRDLWRLIRSFKPDIIHSWNSMCSVYCVPLAKMMRVEFVNGFIRDAREGLTIRDKNYFRGVLTAPFSSAVVANSFAGLAAYKISTKKGYCIHNGFDTARLQKRVARAETRCRLKITTSYVVGMVAVFAKRKDYDSFFKMAASITRQRSDVTFVAVGGGEDLASYRSAWSEARHPQIKLLGERSDVENIVDLFDIGVLASSSVGGEGIPNAIMEYMALSKPVVATDSGGTREIVLDGLTGYLVPVHDVAALKDRVLRLLDNPEMAKKFGENGKKRLFENFNLEKLVDAHLRLYRTLLVEQRD